MLKVFLDVDFCRTAPSPSGQLLLVTLQGCAQSLRPKKKGHPFFFTQEITPASLLKIYTQVNRNIAGKVGQAAHRQTAWPQYPAEDMVKTLQRSIPNSNLVETNTLHKG